MAKNAAAKSFTLGLDADGWYRSAPPQDVDPPSVPTGLAATPGALSVALSWNASTDSHSSVASYSVYQGTSSSGPWTLVTTIGTTSHNVTGLSASTTYWFTVEATDGAGNTSAKATAVSATTLSPGTYPGTIDAYFSTSYEGADPTAEGMQIWSPTGRDAYDHTVDNMVEHSALKAYKGSKSLRVQLTNHRFAGGNTFPNDNVAHLTVTPNPYRHYRKAAGTPNQIAHRNELKWPNSGDFLIAWETEQWIGLAVYLPGESDPDGDAPWRPVSFWSYSIGPQLHSAAGGPGSPLALMHGSAGWPKSADSLAGIPWPAGAPRVRYRRNEDQYNPNSSAFLAQSTSAAKLRVEWDAVDGASTYKVYRSVRSQGPWTEITASGGSITLDKTARQYSEDDLGTNQEPTTNQANAYVYVTAIVGGVESAPSLICPSGRHYWGINAYGASGARPEASFGNALDDLGTWVRIVIRFRLSFSGTGYVQVWKNGTEVAWFDNVNLGHSSSSHHYWRHGIYANVPTESYSLDPLVAADWAAREIVYYDALRMCSRSGGDGARTDTADPAYAAVDPAQYPT